MADDMALAAMFEYYERGGEQDRLDEPAGQLEFARTKQIIARHLPPPPATVADIGGGPGRYSLWLAALGYRVLHRDVVPLHVHQLRGQAAGNPRIDSAVADARDPGLDPGSADAVLLLGPLYHLDHRADRLRALAGAARVVRPGGPVFAAALSRWAARLDGVLRNRLYQSSPLAEALLTGSERTGRLTPLSPGGFTGYTQRPGQLRAEITASGLRLTDLVSVEGPAFLLSDLGERLADDQDRRVVIETAAALGRVPELIGIGPAPPPRARPQPAPRPAGRIRAPELHRAPAGPQCPYTQNIPLKAQLYRRRPVCPPRAVPDRWCRHWSWWTPATTPLVASSARLCSSAMSMVVLLSHAWLGWLRTLWSRPMAVVADGVTPGRSGTGRNCPGGSCRRAGGCRRTPRPAPCGWAARRRARWPAGPALRRAGSVLRCPGRDR